MSVFTHWEAKNSTHLVMDIDVIVFIEEGKRGGRGFSGTDIFIKRIHLRMVM